MTIEQKLILYPDIPQEIQRLNKDLNDINSYKDETRDMLQAQHLSDMPKGGDISNPTLTATIQLIDRYGEHTLHIIDQINEYMDVKEEVDSAWMVLERDEKRVLELRYFDRMRWDWIPAKMHYSRRECFRVHNDAIKKIKQNTKTNMALNGTLYMQ